MPKLASPVALEMPLLPLAKSLLASPTRLASLGELCRGESTAFEPRYSALGVCPTNSAPRRSPMGWSSLPGAHQQPVCILSFDGPSSGHRCRLIAQRAFAISPLNPHIYRGVLYPRVPEPYVLVVLLRTVPGMGAAGDVRYVRRGFFRHFLSRRGLALSATWQNLDLVHTRMQQLKLQLKHQQQPHGLRASACAAAVEQAAAPAEAAPDLEGAQENGDFNDSPALPADDGGPALSWVRQLRIRYVMETEESDGSQLREPLSPQQVLRRLSQEEGLDLLPSQLRLVRQRLLPRTQQQNRQEPSDWPEEILPGRPLGEVTRVGEYDVVALIPTKAKPLARLFCLEIFSRTQLQKEGEAQKRTQGQEAERRTRFAFPSLR